MAGRRKTPCEYCGDEMYASAYKTHKNGYCLWYECYPFNNVISCLAQANDEDGEMIEDYVDIPMNYCPNCGRKLID